MALEVSSFPTVFGRGLLAELKHIAAPKYLIVTMRDLWSLPTIRKNFPKEDDTENYSVYFVESLEIKALRKDLQAINKPTEQIKCVIGLGGGQAVDVAKFFSWSLGGTLLFLLPTALTVDASWGHRAAIRCDGVVKYVGFATPSAVYVDYDVVRSAPLELNLSGVGDVLCFHTAHFDWKLADQDAEAGQWPYKKEVVAMAKSKLDAVVANVREIKEMSEKGIQILVSALQFGGGAYHSLGWNPRPLEGFDHLFFYALEHNTGKRFIHGYPVMLGVYLGSLLQKNRPDFVLKVLKDFGVDIRPEKMGICWEDVRKTLFALGSFIEKNGYMYTIASKVPITQEFVEEARAMLYDSYKGIP